MCMQISLVIGDQGDSLWGPIMVLNDKTDTLTHLTLPCTLDLDLALALDDLTPALQELTVDAIDPDVYEEEVEEMGESTHLRDAQNTHLKCLAGKV
jgi:hypothetical protein